MSTETRPQRPAERPESLGRTDDSGQLPDWAQASLEALRLSFWCFDHKSVRAFCDHKHKNRGPARDTARPYPFSKYVSDLGKPTPAIL